MITKRTNLLAGSLLGGALLLGTAGLVLARDPTPTPSPTTGTPGGMMNGQGMAAGQMPDMTAMHAAMGKDGAFDLELMQSMHDQYHPSN